MANCALCEKEAVLCDSHVLPAFAFRWMRERSISGHIRSTDNINVRVQDGLKKPWLCSDCEKLICREEQAFATNLFHPWQNGPVTVEYGDWLNRFCTSVSWRVLKHCKGLNTDHVYTKTEDEMAGLAEQSWRRYLLGQQRGVGKFEQHILPMHIIESSTIPDLPNNINRYLTGGIEMDIVGTSKTMMTFAKLGNFMIFGMISKGRGPWEGSRVNAFHGYIGSKKYVLPKSLLGYIKERARHSSEALDGMSPKQRAKVDTSIMNNIDGMADSPHLRAIRADAEMFGERAILRRNNE
jgi:hypothetical protein